MDESWRAGAKLKKSFAHLLNRECVIERGDWNVSTVENGVLGSEWVQAPARIETAERCLPG